MRPTIIDCKCGGENDATTLKVRPLNPDYFNMRLSNVTNGTQNDTLQAIIGSSVKIIASARL